MQERGEGDRAYPAEQASRGGFHAEQEIFHAAALNKGAIEKNSQLSAPIQNAST